jgi:hypothetical protein
VTLDEALAYDATSNLACEHWCAALSRPAGLDPKWKCDCGMARARAVIALLQGAAEVAA